MKFRITGGTSFLSSAVIRYILLFLLEVVQKYWNDLNLDRKIVFRFSHIFAKEVYANLEGPEGLFTERTAYAPSSPYSACRAGLDHLVRAWYRTYGLPVLISNHSNIHGPYHLPEKQISLIILNTLVGRPLPAH